MIRRTSLLSVVVLSAAAACLAACASPGPETDPAANLADPDATEEVVLRVTGMTCPVLCPRHVREMLSAAPGVVYVTIEWDIREAHCTVKRGTDPQSLVHALRTPYAARVAE